MEAISMDEVNTNVAWRVEDERHVMESTLDQLKEAMEEVAVARERER